MGGEADWGLGEGTGDSLRSVLTFSLSLLVLSSHTHLQHLHTASRISHTPSGSLRKLPEGPRSRSPGACEGHTCRVHALRQCGWGWAEHTCGLHGCWGQGPEQLGPSHDFHVLSGVLGRAPSRGPAHGLSMVAAQGPPQLFSMAALVAPGSSSCPRAPMGNLEPLADLSVLTGWTGRVAGSYSTSSSIVISAGACSGGHSAHVQVKSLKPDPRGNQVRPTDGDAAQDGQLRRRILT